MKKYDYLIVGAGLFGATCAQQLNELGKKVLVIDKRNSIAGNAYTERKEGILVHKHGPHIFHTNNHKIWSYLNRFSTFNDFINSPKANYKGEIFSLPFNMHTFNEMWGVNTPEDALKIIEKQRIDIPNPQNLEEQALSLVGTDIYEKIIKGYSEKQWGRSCSYLPPSIIKRLPLRFTYNNNYYNDLYQGIPVGGYTKMVEHMLDGVETILNTDYLPEKYHFDNLAANVIYSGAIDEYYDYRFGRLEYRSLCFETETLDVSDFQGNAVVNYTDSETPWTRIIEHKWFEPKPYSSEKNISKTIISREYSVEWKPGTEQYYPILNVKNVQRYLKYKQLAECDSHVYFGGRLGEYKYYNMDQVVESALNMVHQI